MTLMDKIILKLMIILSCVLFVVVGVSLFYPFNPLEIEQPVKVLQDEYNAGDTVVVEFDFKKNTSIIPEITLALVDGVVYTIPTYKPINQVGQVTGKRVAVLDIPLSIPCGEYHLVWVASYRYNTLRTVEVEYESEPFRINNTICAE